MKEKIKKLFFKLFKPKEIKVALDILDEAGQVLDGAGFQLVRNHIEKAILAQPDKFMNIIQKGTSPRKWIYTAIANTAGDLVESGNYHIYRGVLNPLGPGNELLKIFDGATDELTKIGVLDAKKAKAEKEVMRKNIGSVG